MRKLFLVAASFLLAEVSLGATCTVTEFERLPQDVVGRVLQVAPMPYLASSLVTYTSSTQSNVFQTETYFIRIQCDAAAHVNVGTNPTATTADPRIPEGGVEYFAITRRGLRVALYDGTTE